MREIKFRALDFDGNWQKGSFVNDMDAFICAHHLPSDPELPLIRVKRSTVGQYTGLKDWNGVEIYEGDIIRIHKFTRFTSNNTEEVFESETVCFDQDDAKFALQSNDLKTILYRSLAEKSEIIGNIHQNKELLT